MSLSLVLDFISFIILVSRRLFLFYFSLYFILLFCYGYSLLPYLYRVPYVHSYVHPSIRPFFLFTTCFFCFPSHSSSPVLSPFRSRFPTFISFRFVSFNSHFHLPSSPVLNILSPISIYTPFDTFLKKLKLFFLGTECQAQ